MTDADIKDHNDIEMESLDQSVEDTNVDRNVNSEENDDRHGEVQKLAQHVNEKGEIIEYMTGEEYI